MRHLVQSWQTLDPKVGLLIDPIRVLARLKLKGSQVVRGMLLRARAPRRRLMSMIRTAPLPKPLRRSLYTFGAWRPWTSVVSIDHLMLGPQNSRTAAEFAEIMGDLMWPSTRVIDGPHSRLLQMAAGTSRVTDEDIVQSAYGDMARSCIAGTGNFFSATSEAEIVTLARRFMTFADPDRADHEPDEHPGVLAQSPSGSIVRASRIVDSDYYQINDGHHRVAALAQQGQQSVRIRKSWLAVSTPLQDLLNDMSWIRGARELYQPIHAPELERSWRTVRRCDDRLAKMKAFLHARVGDPQGMSYLDVASCYGWFVNEMAAAGLDSHGVERDPAARRLARAVYGLDEGRVTIADAAEFLGRQEPNSWDVVSCLSLLHHLALGRGPIDLESMVGLLDRVTRRVLFIDTGQAHEEWFKRTLPEWDSDYIREYLVANTTFDSIVDLGPDDDARGAYRHNYGRTLFACFRSGSETESEPRPGSSPNGL